MVQLAVAVKDSEWTVFEDGKPIVKGMSRTRSIELAERLAQAAGDVGEEVELLVQDYVGRIDTRRSPGRGVGGPHGVV
jgi:hypothetical protein